MNHPLNEERARKLLGAEDAVAADAAFKFLEPPIRDFLRCHLRKELSDADTEDVTQETLIRIWAGRKRFVDRGPASWRAFAKRVADHCRIDLLRSRGVSEVSAEEVPEREFAILDRLLENTGSAEEIAEYLHQADVLWLELDPSRATAEHRRRLLAAQLFYRERASCSEILSILNASGLGAVRREELDQWLIDPAVLRQLAYSVLYQEGIALACQVLALEAEQCRTILASGIPPRSDEGCACRAQETAVAVLRLVAGLAPDQISARTDCDWPLEKVLQLSDRLAAAFPFSALMRELLEAIQDGGRIDGAPHLGRIGLWQRLAFQYRYWEDLPLRDIQQRVAPPAAEVDVDVNPGKLNMWLSGGRLTGRLARHLERSGVRDGGC